MSNLLQSASALRAKLLEYVPALMARASYIGLVPFGAAHSTHAPFPLPSQHPIIHPPPPERADEDADVAEEERHEAGPSSGHHRTRQSPLPPRPLTRRPLPLHHGRRISSDQKKLRPRRRPINGHHVTAGTCRFSSAIAVGRRGDGCDHHDISLPSGWHLN
jgi:hypothetical protein